MAHLLIIMTKRAEQVEVIGMCHGHWKLAGFSKVKKQIEYDEDKG